MTDDIREKVRHSERRAADTGGRATDAAERTTDATQNMLTGFQTLTARWWESRQEALAATMEAMQKTAQARDPAELLRIQQEWMIGETQRVMTDINNLTRDMMRLTQSGRQAA